MSALTIDVLAGGLSPERDVSLRSGRRVAEALRDLQIATRERDIDARLIPTWREDRPSCVIPMVHGAAGEDGALREVLECLSIPFVGSGAAACRLAFDKAIAKTLARGAGIATPDSVALPQSAFRELGAQDVLDGVIAVLGLPLIVKPTRGGSALGVTFVANRPDLPAAMVAACAYSDVVLLERWVAGTEVAVCVIESNGHPESLPVIEIAPPGPVYDYDARYVAGATEFHVPARLEAAYLTHVAEAAVTMHRALGLRDLSRSDWIIDAAGQPWFLEVNVAPGMTETSLFPQALGHAGLSLGTTFETLARRAVELSGSSGPQSLV